MSNRSASDLPRSDADAFCGRTLRWYEWLAALALLALAAGVRAESAYRCDAAGGAVTYQAEPCDAGSVERRVAFDPRPSHVVAPDYALPAPQKSSAGERPLRNARQRDSEPQSYECRASDGEVFYRLSGCPRSLPGPAAAGRGANAKAAHVTVSARVVPRSEACAAMRRAGAIGRNGHARDEDVSTYDKNLGRDPCK